MPRRLMGKQGREMASKKSETSATSTKQSPFKSRIDVEKSFKKSPKKTTRENGNDSDSSINEDEEFVVERIVAVRKTRTGRTEYNVKWLGYDKSQNTWEPRSNLHHCDDLLRQFEADQAAKFGEKAGLTTCQLKKQKRTKTADASNDLEEQASSSNRKKQRLEIPQKKKEKASFGSGSEGSDKSGQIPTPRSQFKKQRRRLFTHEDFDDVPTIDIKEEETTPPPLPLESGSKGKKAATRKIAPRGSTKPKKDEAKEEKDDENKWNEGRQSRSDTKPKPKKVKNVRDQDEDEEREREESDQEEPIKKRVDRASAKSSNLKNHIGNEAHDGSSKKLRRRAVSNAKLDEDDSDEDGHRDRSRKATTIRKPVATKKKEDQAPRKRKTPKYEEDEDQNDDDDQAVPTKILCATRQQISKKKFLVQYAVELAKMGARGRNDNQPSYAIWRSSRLFAANPRLIVDWWETSAYWPKCEQDANELLNEDAKSDVHHVSEGSLNDMGVVDQIGDEHANESDGTSSFEAGRDESGNEDSQSGNGDRLAIDDQAVQALESGGDSGESNGNENRLEEIESEPPSDGDEFENAAGTSAGTDGGETSATSVSID